MSPSITEVLTFLTFCFDDLHLGYSALNTARSALSSFITIDNHPVGSHPLVVRLLKGIFHTKPALPKNTVIWDVNVVLLYLKSLSPATKLTLKELSRKAVTLAAILTGQRCQSLYYMDVRNMTINKYVVKFRFGDLLKQSRPGFQLNEIVVKAFVPDRRLCLVTVLLEYLKRTASFRNGVTQLFMTTVKPHHAATKQTLSKWIKNTLSLAGINMGVFTPHSVRSASTSAADSANIPLNTILQTAGWSQAGTFAKFYNKPIVKTGTFAKAVLQKDTVVSSSN